MLKSRKKKPRIEIEIAHRAGADGVVVGALRPGGERISTEAMRPLVEAARARALSVTFHRAFDAVAHPGETLEALIELGVARVLTSGTAWGSGAGALDGIARLQALIRQAGGRIELVLGGGIRARNVRRILGQLPLEGGRVSVHAYSGVLKDGLTDAAAVEALVRAVRAG